MILPPPATTPWIEALHARLEELRAIAKDRAERHALAIKEENRADQAYRLAKAEIDYLERALLMAGNQSGSVDPDGKKETS